MTSGCSPVPFLNLRKDTEEKEEGGLIPPGGHPRSVDKFIAYVMSGLKPGEGSGT